tara:strand:- start:1377 stop:2339 length:963 start_codon:yes stop_codon:yes gene_type:complete
MIRFFCYGIGIDFSMIKGHEKLLRLFIFLLITILFFTLIGFFYAIYNSTESLLLAIPLSIFFTLIVFNIYRLVFSSSEGELSKDYNFKDVSLFVMKKAIVLILLSFVVSKSIGVYVFDNDVDFYLNKYKNSLKVDFNKSLELSQAREINSIIDDFETKVSDDILFERFSEISVNNYTKERDLKLAEIEKSIELKNKVFQKKLDSSTFFLTRIRLLSSKIPQSWLLTIFLMATFLVPIYMILLTPIFKEYDFKCDEVSKKIIVDEYMFFLEKYKNLMLDSTGKKIVFEEKFEDPPFNKIKIKSKIKTLKKGSLLKWIENFS